MVIESNNWPSRNCDQMIQKYSCRRGKSFWKKRGIKCDNVHSWTCYRNVKIFLVNGNSLTLEKKIRKEIINSCKLWSQFLKSLHLRLAACTHCFSIDTVSKSKYGKKYYTLVQSTVLNHSIEDKYTFEDTNTYDLREKADWSHKEDWCWWWLWMEYFTKLMREELFPFRR